VPHLPVAVWASLPTYRRRLVVALTEAGFKPDEPDHLEAWVVAEGRRAVVVPVHHPTPSVATLRELNPDLAIIALLKDPSADAYREALGAGASAGVPWDAPVTRIVEVVRAAFDHHSLFPIPIARALANSACSRPVLAGLSATKADGRRKLRRERKLGRERRSLRWRWASA
jgi:hypothetical protein